MINHYETLTIYPHFRKDDGSGVRAGGFGVYRSGGDQKLPVDIQITKKTTYNFKGVFCRVVTPHSEMNIFRNEFIIIIIIIILK